MADPQIQFIQDLAVVTGVAALTGILFQRIRLPLVFGLLIAGVIIGPHTPPFTLVQDFGTLEVLANLGVTLLLFGLGLDFNLRGLRKLGLPALLVTTAEILLMFGIGYQTGRWLGFGNLDSAFLGAMLSISSTAIIVAVLRELGRLDAESSRLVFAVLVLEDIAAILILVLLGGYTATGDLPLREAFLVLARMSLFLLAFLLLGLLVIPRFLHWVAQRFRPEVVVLTVIGLALSGAILSELVGFHVGLGAFLVGALCAESKSRAIVEERFRPIHDLFAAIFFVAIGTLVDFRVLADQWVPVLLVTVAIIVGKTLSGTAAAFVAGFTPRTSFAVGAALAQIGEFSFVIAALGLSSGAMDVTLFPIIVGAAAISSFTSPIMIRTSDSISTGLARLMPLSVRTYSSVYTGFLHTWREKPRIQHPEALRKERRSAIASGTLLLLGWGGALVLQRIAVGFLEARNIPAAPLVYWALCLAVLAASFIEMMRHVSRWIELSYHAQGRTEGLGVRQVVRMTMYLGTTLLLGLPILIAAGRATDSLVALGLWLTVVAAATFVLWRGIRRLHHRVSENIGHLLEDEQARLEVPEVLETLMSKGFPAEFGVGNFVLSANSVWAERRLAETQIRTTTGASIVLIERPDGRQVVPGPDTLLLAGDRLTFIGAHEQIAMARELLGRLRATDHARIPLHPGRIVVEEGQPLDGKLLVESGLRSKHGLHVVAIQRGEQAIPNPGPSERIVAGDVLIVLGTREQIFGAVEDAHGDIHTPTHP